MATVTATTRARPGTMLRGGPTLWQRMVRERWMYVFILPGALYFLVLEYVPLLGNVIALQRFSPFLGLTGSPFIGLENFQRLISDEDFRLVLINTIQIQLLKLLFDFNVPLLLAHVQHSYITIS